MVTDNRQFTAMMLSFYEKNGFIDERTRCHHLGIIKGLRFTKEVYANDPPRNTGLLALFSYEPSRYCGTIESSYTGTLMLFRTKKGHVCPELLEAELQRVTAEAQKIIGTVVIE